MKAKKKSTKQKLPTIKTIGIVGAGQMGKGIAQVAAQTGFQVIVVSPYEETIEKAKQYVATNLDRAVEIGKINKKERDKINARLTFSMELQNLKTADIVIEAVVENRGVKEDVFSNLDKICPPHAILTTNTSSVPIAKLAKVTGKSWVYFKRAHLHSQTMGIIAIVFALLTALLNFQPKFQLGISLLSGLGSLGYGVFWLLAALLAPGMGSTHAAKESVSLIAQLSGGAFFVSGVALFVLAFLKLFVSCKQMKVEHPLRLI